MEPISGQPQKERLAFKLVTDITKSSEISGAFFAGLLIRCQDIDCRQGKIRWKISQQKDCVRQTKDKLQLYKKEIALGSTEKSCLR